MQQHPLGLCSSLQDICAKTGSLTPSMLQRLLLCCTSQLQDSKTTDLIEKNQRHILCDTMNQDQHLASGM